MHREYLLNNTLALVLCNINLPLKLSPQDSLHIFSSKRFKIVFDHSAETLFRIDVKNLDFDVHSFRLHFEVFFFHIETNIEYVLLN